ncbi:MAG: hypothetical protein ACK5PF_11145 [bacterium]
MTINDLITLASNRATLLEHQRSVATFQGDTERIAALEAQLSETQETLSKLRSLT